MSSKVAALLAEFIGTFMLVFTLGCTVLSGTLSDWGPTAVACTLMVMIYAFGPVSGGHLNPAVSLAVAFANKFGGAFSGWPMVPAYITAQVAGGIAAGFSYRAVFQAEVPLDPKEPFGWWKAMVVEAIFTAMLAFVVLSVATSKRNNPEGNQNQFYGLAIGFVVVAGGYGARPISNAILNPAVAIGLDVSSLDDGVYQGFVYAAWQAVGAILASLLFRLTRPEDYPRDARAATAYEPTLPTRLASEFLGTYVLVLTVGLNVLGKSGVCPWAAAASLMCMIYSLGDVSGAHFNPAVTLAVVLSRKGNCSPREGLAYAAIQVLAAVLAGLLYTGLYQSQTITMAPKHLYSDQAAYIVEFIFTFVLAFVVLSTACVKGISSPLSRNYYFALAIGSCVTAGGFAGGAVSCGVFNPAVAFGVAVPNTLNNGGLYYCMTYCLVQLAAGVCAALIFYVTHAQEYSAKADRALFTQG